MKQNILRSMAIALIVSSTAMAQDSLFGWPQWGQNQLHLGLAPTVGQGATSILADKIYDPFAAAEMRDSGGDLLVHYQVPLLHGNDVFMAFKTGRFIECVPAGSRHPPPGESDCGQSAWNSQIWNEKRLHWEAGQLVEKWNFQSDWKAVRIELAEWEPVFHAVLAGGFIYVPGAGGSIFKLDKGTGVNLGRINPFPTLDPNTFVAGPLSADFLGNIYYNAIQFTDQTPRFYPGLVDSWLVKVATDGTVTKVSYGTLLAPVNPPGPLGLCERSFFNNTLPWPGSPTAPAPLRRCGAQRPALNIAPAIALDGIIYTASRGHLPAGDRQAYVIAVNPNLTLKWATSLKNTLTDGCGVTVPIASVDMPATGPWDLASFKGKCRRGTTVGVDPATNRPGSGRILDSGTSSPTVLPDGNVLFGAYTRYNVGRGHTYKLSQTDGAILGIFDFGWDDTPAVLPRLDGSYSIVMKDNHYDEEIGYYCSSTDIFGNQLKTVSQGGNPLIKANVVCDFTTIPAGPFYITQVDSNLVPQWQFQATETRRCSRNPDGTLACIDDGKHPNGFEWCVNAPAIDLAGNVYVESEDGFVYVIDQDHSGVFTTPMFQLFTNLALGATSTPFSLDHAGRLHVLNNGHLFAIGGGGRSIDHRDEGRGDHSPRRHPGTDDDNE